MISDPSDYRVDAIPFGGLAAWAGRASALEGDDATEGHLPPSNPAIWPHNFQIAAQTPRSKQQMRGKAARLGNIIADQITKKTAMGPTGMTGKAAALLVEEVHKSFGHHHVLKGVSLSAQKGDVISLIGSSGSGKSTFLRCINFLEIPDRGRFVISGEENPDEAEPGRTRASGQLATDRADPDRPGHGVSELQPVGSYERARQCH